MVLVQPYDVLSVEVSMIAAPGDLCKGAYADQRAGGAKKADTLLYPPDYQSRVKLIMG
jgi:hypothetical protein